MATATHLFQCPNCSGTLSCVALPEVLCPSCLWEMDDVGLSSSGLSYMQTLEQQGALWKKLEERGSPPRVPLTKDYLDGLLGGPKVDGALDPETGRFYLRGILLADGGKLLLGTSGTQIVVFNHEEP